LPRSAHTLRIRYAYATHTLRIRYLREGDISEGHVAKKRAYATHTLRIRYAYAT
jgi:hypothetical protein